MFHKLTFDIPFILQFKRSPSYEGPNNGFYITYFIPYFNRHAPK